MSPRRIRRPPRETFFFPPAVFKVFDGEVFILQVHGVFTRIRSGATVVVFRQQRAWIYTPLKGDSAYWRWLLARPARNGCKCVG
jgi:hypothetical protein